MKQSILLTTLLASYVAATPLLVTTYEMFTVTETVTGTDASATTYPQGGSSGWWDGFSWHWGGRGSSAPAAAPATTTTPAAQAPAYTPPPVPQVESSAPAFQAPAPQPTTTSASQPESTGSVSSYAQAILDQHNNHRDNASVPHLVWSDSMASIAQQIAASCVYAHNTQAGGGGYGQNIGAGADESGVPAMITNEMYNGEINWYPTPYGQANPDMTNFEHWGHYSQIVWKSTTSVGCYTEYCPGGLANVGGDVSPYFTVCNYSPPGNFGGEYGDNVLQPGNMATVTV